MDGNIAIGLGELFSGVIEKEGVMMKVDGAEGVKPQCLREILLRQGRIPEILSSYDQVDAVMEIVHHGGQLISRKAVLLPDDKVLHGGWKCRARFGAQAPAGVSSVQR